jgi:hypothetical protein
MPGPVRWQSVTTEFNGKEIAGSYLVNMRTVTVRYGGDSKSVRAGGSPEATAKAALRDLANEADQRSKAK